MTNWRRSFESVRGGCWARVDALGASCPWVPPLTEDGSGDWDIFFGPWMSGKHKIENRNNAVRRKKRTVDAERLCQLIVRIL